MALVPGRRVRLRELQSRSELNGREAVILPHTVENSDRIAVQLVGASDSGQGQRLAVRPANLECDFIDFRLRLGENDELLVAAILPHLDVASLCQLRAADSKLSPLVRLELRGRPLRWRFEHDWRHAPEIRREALFDRAWSHEGFADDRESDWFCRSLATRDERPAELRLRVGDLFQHQSTGYLGYVIAWDSRTRAPRAWVETHRRIQAPGTRCDRLFAPHLSVREFVPDEHMPQGIGFQTRYVIEDQLRPFDPDGLGRAEAQAVQTAWAEGSFEAGGSEALPTKFYWRVLSALHNDAMMLPILASIGGAEPGNPDALKVLGEGRGGVLEPSLGTMFGAMMGRIEPREEGVAPRGDDDLVFRGSGRLVPNATMRARYPRDG